MDYLCDIRSILRDIFIGILDLRAGIGNLCGMDVLPDPEAYSMTSLDYFRMKKFRSPLPQLRRDSLSRSKPPFVEPPGIKMRTWIFRALAPLTLLAMFLVHSAPAQTVVQSPDQLLSEATKASLNGNYKTALSKARKAKSNAKGDLSFCIRYISSVTSIAELSDDRHRSSLFNEALKAANEVETTKVGDGTQDAEFSWNYMVSIGKLADSLIGTSSKTSGKLYLAQAKIAANLQKNPGFPRESLSLLTKHLMGKAYAYACKNDEAKTLTSLQAAFDAGFNDFESLTEHEFITDLDSKQVNALISKKLAAYKLELKTWARDAVANFNSFQFKFDVADIDAGRIRNSDYRGRILVLDLWATWCQPCREAIPHFVKLDEKFRNKKVEVVGISMDNPDNPVKSLKVVRKFVDENGVEYAMAMGNRSVMNQLAPGQKLPTVLFIDSKGRVRYIAEGPHNFCQLSAITDELIDLEKKSPTSIPAHTAW